MPIACSGKDVIRILIRQFGFVIVGQKGSHVKLKRQIRTDTRVTVVPLHKELAHGTLRGILKLADIKYEDFLPKK